MYIYEPWVPVAGRDGAESDAGVEKASAASVVVAAAAGLRGTRRGRGRRWSTGASCETEAPGPCRSKNIQINSTRLAPMMAANVVQHKTRDLAGPVRARASGRTSSRTYMGARTCIRVHTRHLPPRAFTRPCMYMYVRIHYIYVCIYVSHVDVYLSRRCTYPRRIYTPKTSPLTPFAVVYIYIYIYRCSLFSRCCRFLFFFLLVFPSSQSRSPRRATIHLSSPSLVYVGKTLGPCW